MIKKEGFSVKKKTKEHCLFDEVELTDEGIGLKFREDKGFGQIFNDMGITGILVTEVKKQ